MGKMLAFISDMHIAPQKAGAERAQSNRDRPARRVQHLQKAIEEVRKSSPAALFYGGDNTNQPISRPAYRDALLPLLQSGPGPWRIIPGNHDIGSTVGWHHHDPALMKKALEAFRSVFGNDYWTCEAGGFQIIGINSQIFGSTLDEAGEQAQWLLEMLQEDTDLIRAVFLHTPPYLQGWEDDFSDGSEQMCLKKEARKPLMDILLAHPPDILISTHVHRFWVRSEPAWAWIGIPATALGLDEMDAVPEHNVPAGDDRVGWVALERTGDSWSAEFHPLCTD